MIKNPFSSKRAGAAIEEQTPEEVVVGKGHATPTRKEREAARIRPLVPNDRREAAKASRAKTAELRNRARVGMAAGEEKYLTARDRGPQKRFIRQHVDARFSVGEFMIPVMVLIIIISVIQSPGIQAIGMLVLWVFFIVMVIDCLILGQILIKKLEVKFGAGNVERGVRWYAAMRAIQLRVIRLPKPQVKRGEYPK